jgi:hypothetical protein
VQSPAPVTTLDRSLAQRQCLPSRHPGAQHASPHVQP